MNLPKFVCIVVVILCTGYLLYPTIDSAIPKGLDGSPFSVEMGEGGVDITMDDDMNFSVTMPKLTFGSKLPEDLKDVTVEVFLGSGDKRVSAGLFDFGTVPSNGSLERIFTSNDMNATFFMSYIPSLGTSDGKLDLPISLGIKFKYMEWQGVELLDLGIVVKASGTESNGDVTKPVVTGNESVVTVTPDDGMVKTLAQKMYAEYGDSIEVAIGDGSKDLGKAEVTVNSDGKLIMKAVGATIDGVSMTMYDILKKMYDENDGKLTFHWDSKTFTIDGDQAKAVLNAAKAFYPEGDE